MTVLRVALVCVLAAACVHSSEVVCSDGRICPPGNTCDDANHRCLSPEQVAACSGHADGDPCTLAAIDGVCKGGVCEPLVCGDGVRTGTELCDGIDLGTADCTAAGFYDKPGLACTQFCTFDTSMCTGKCGDGIVNGPELCDGAPPEASCFDEGFDAGGLACSSGCGASFVGCARFGWRPELTGVSNQDGLAGLAANDLWTTGKNGTDGVVAHFDGVAWTIATTVPGQSVLAIAEAAPGDVWAVASGSIVLHLANGQWTTVTSAPTATYKDVSIAGTLVAIATSDAGVLAWNGTAWQTVGTLASALTFVRGTSAQDLWALQADGTLQHWDGASWTPAGPANVLVRRIAVLSPTDVWVVGSNTQALGNVTAHWNGTAWTAYVDTATYSALAILPLADNDVWVAYNGSGNGRHFDGIRWTYFQNVATPGVSFGSLLATPSELVAISFNGIAYRFSGQVYAQLSADTGDVNASGTLWSDAPDDIYVGDGTGHVLHFDGQSWTTTAVASGAIVALWGTRGDDVWAVARVATNTSPVFHYDGVGWTNPPGITNVATAVWGSASNDVWFVTNAGLYHYDGSSITLSLAIIGEKISGTGADDVWVTGAGVTAGGAAYHWDGTAWNPPMQLAHHVNALVAVAPNDVFASGDGSHVMHYDGTAWSDTQLLVFDPLNVASASAPDDVYVASATTIFQFDGSRWARVRAPSDSGLGGATLAQLIAHRGWIDMLFTSGTNTQQIRELVRTRPWNCRASETDCDDGVDDDCDGKVDHLDPDCP